MASVNGKIASVIDADTARADGTPMIKVTGTGGYKITCSIGELAMGARQCWPKLDSQPQLEQTRLGRLTLEDAQARMETLLAQIGLTGYQCVYALDMSVERIYDLGEKFRKGLDSSNVPLPAFETATEKDEGFYLYYEKILDGVSLEHERQDAGQFSACAYITAEGLHLFHLRDSHVIGDVYETPDRLLTADEARAAFEKGNPKRQRDGFQNAQAVSLTLTYRPIRAPQKKDGVVLSPAWLIEYTFSDGGQNDGYAWYSATAAEKDAPEEWVSSGAAWLRAAFDSGGCVFYGRGFGNGRPFTGRPRPAPAPAGLEPYRYSCPKHPCCLARQPFLPVRTNVWGL